VSARKDHVYSRTNCVLANTPPMVTTVGNSALSRAYLTSGNGTSCIDTVLWIPSSIISQTNSSARPLPENKPDQFLKAALEPAWQIPRARALWPTTSPPRLSYGRVTFKALVQDIDSFRNQAFGCKAEQVTGWDANGTRARTELVSSPRHLDLKSLFVPGR